MSANVTPTLADKLSGYLHQSGLHALLEAVCAKLRTQDLISMLGVRVLPEYHADLYNSLNLVLNKKLSVLIVVGFDRINKGDKSLSVYFKGMQLSVDVYENVLINQAASGTRTSALSLAEASAVHLHGFQPEKTAVLVNPGQLMLAESSTLQQDREKSDLKNGLVCYNVSLTTGGCLSAQRRAAAPALVEAATGFTASTATPSAAIYWTSDGSTPSATNGFLYPLYADEQATATIKAIAVLAGLLDSEVSTLNLAQIPP